MPGFTWWRPILYKDVFESAKAVVIYMRKRKVNIKCQEYSNQARRVGADNYVARSRAEYGINSAMGPLL
ncbi:hypothetical protein BDN72DRAFT_905526 [Pluteus cervinus]|uniref:Uncharacterized protein n=1 Tax=Pluteus cervinus TaxID=181527 RepID=A0ACD3A273_9AGAR|nr:hypothetical protein BDN72DRAFT_905526 [Pluteus cervinus]